MDSISKTKAFLVSSEANNPTLNNVLAHLELLEEELRDLKMMIQALVDINGG
jgi:hypothetical protein